MTQCAEWHPVWERIRDHGKPVSERDVAELAHVRDMGAPTTLAHRKRLKCRPTVHEPGNAPDTTARIAHNQRQALGAAVLAAIGMTPMERIYR